MSQRPRSVTVISWLLIVVGAVGCLTFTVSLSILTSRQLLAHGPMPLSVSIADAYLAIVVGIVSGIFMLKAANWARRLYVIFTGVSVVVTAALFGVSLSLLPGTLFYGIAVLLLSRPAVNEYFGDRLLPVWRHRD